MNTRAKKYVEETITTGVWKSVITRIEILGWPNQSENSMIAAKMLLNELREQMLTKIIVQKCISLRQHHRI
ncbi:hypothetical protein JW935_10645 [candidate division KSB1 bacterium]|nr:hypothetical protein [candidate division KSB1 bacterium]